MSLRKLFEGHYRALENRYASLVGELSDSAGGLTVVTADSSQMERLRGLTLQILGGGRVLGGVRFFPGMVALAEKLSPLPVKAEQVSHADRTLFAIAAMKETRPGEPLHDLEGNVETAHSMAGFFEDLLDQGISSSTYRIQADSDKVESLTVDVVGRIFAAYQALRDRCYPSAGSAIIALPIPGNVSGDFIFYGFYDLNPGQRAVVRKLAACPGVRIYWFSPLGELSPWADVYVRTREFLTRIGIAETVNCGGDSEMGGLASFLETLPSQARPIPPLRGFRVIAASGPMGAARAVLRRVVALGSGGLPLSSVAVVCRSRVEGRMIARLAWHEEVPVAAPLESDPGSMPFGRLLGALLDVEADGFHYLTLQRLAMSGLLKPDLSPEPGEIVGVVLSTGIRMDRARWTDWTVTGGEGHERLCRLLSGICLFYGGLPEKALPAEYAGRLEKLFVSLVPEEPVRAILDLLFDRESFRSPVEVSWSVFSRALRINLDSLTVSLIEGRPEGFHILTPEQARGGLFPGVILTGMEEGVWPSVPTEDPRLPDSFRKLLQLPLKKDREQEDGFLLRQMGEAAGESLDLVYTQRDACGAEVYPSPFIAPLVTCRSDGPSSDRWFTRESSSPHDVLLGGTAPGQAVAREASRGLFSGKRSFLGCVMRAEAARLGTGAFERWDGVIGGPVFQDRKVSASMLERYVRCPFLFMAEWVWGLKERRTAGVSAEPDPLMQGKVLHRAVETLVMEYGFSADRAQVRTELGRASVEQGLEAALGSRDLEELFLGSRVERVKRCLDALAARNWAPRAAEVELSGTLDALEITGRLDLLLEDSDGGLVVLDLKTGSLPPRKDTEEGLVFQLPFYYALVTQNEIGREVAWVYYASLADREPGRLEGFPGGQMNVLMPSVAHRAGGLAALIKEGVFPPWPSQPSRCKDCGFRHLCRRTPEERLDRKAAADPRLTVMPEADR